VQVNEFFTDHAGAMAGVGNSLAGVKWRFLDQTNWSWLEVSTYPQLEFIYPISSARRGLGDRGNNVLLPIEVEHTLKKLTIYADGGYVINQYRANEGWFGLAGEYELTEKFSIMGEIYGGYDRNFRNDGASFNLGFSRPLSGHAALIGAAGRGLFGGSDRAPAFQSYLGIQWTF
jgi:hypothetical protein